MTIHPFNLDTIDPSWQSCIPKALGKMDPTYLNTLYHNTHWLPGHDKIFNAFSIPVHKVNYILFGESPYPRAASANGYAFWDAAVLNLWSETGLNKKVNRATSLRHIIKMLLICEGVLNPGHTTQPDIANINKEAFVTTNQELFNNFLSHGFLLLNASLVLQPMNVRKDALSWHPFISHVLDFLCHERPNLSLILLGKIANTINTLVPQNSIKKLYAEHPYNHSFIQNEEVIQFFMPLHLLKKETK